MSDFSDKTDDHTHQVPKGRPLVQRARRVLAGLAVLILVLVLAGAVYQAIASVVILVLALADEVYRLVARKT